MDQVEIAKHREIPENTKVNHQAAGRNPQE
jgi:hypothetical protein